jgi:hypothetical protein
MQSLFEVFDREVDSFRFRVIAKQYYVFIDDHQTVMTSIYVPAYLIHAHLNGREAFGVAENRNEGGFYADGFARKTSLLDEKHLA